MKKTSLSIFFAIVLTGSHANASEYIYRDLMGNSIAPQRCNSLQEAEGRARDAYTIEKFSKRFCETQGYGWYLSEQKTSGKLVCDPCASESADQYRCHVEDITVSCKRLKPGTAGLIPGQS